MIEKFWTFFCLVYAFGIGCYHGFNVSEKYFYTYDFSELKKHDTYVNRFLLLIVEKSIYLAQKRQDRYSPHKRKERRYIYYLKKICNCVMILAVPWFVTFYFTGWYLNKKIYVLHMMFPFSLLGIYILMRIIVLTCDIKSIIYRKRQHKYKKTRNQS